MNIEPRQAALFDTYNARFMGPRTIARSFVMPPNAFWLLCKDENSILIGPRGSGKTTLMQMLRPRTLREWKHSDKEKVLAEINFQPVYIGADSSWTDRMSLYRAGSEEYRIFEILHNATIVTYLLEAMIVSIEEGSELQDIPDLALRKFSFAMSVSVEIELVTKLAALWRLDIDIPSLKALRFALQLRIQIIDDVFFSISTLRQHLTLDTLHSHSFISLDIVSVIKGFVSAVNDIMSPNDRIWAFCFDEIEILPVELQASLIRSLRSIKDQRIRFKLSASPFSKASLPRKDPTIPMGGHDFSPITLTYARKHEAVRFGRQILEALLREIGAEASPLQLLGGSHFEPDVPRGPPRKLSPYRKGGTRFKALSELEQNDPGFAEYLRSRGIVLDVVSGTSEDERAEVRKLIQIAAIRREFGLSNDASNPSRMGSRLRSRKRIVDLYTGAESLLCICEGNPRWLIGMLRPLIGNLDAGLSVPRPRQARSISTAIARFLALLSTIPLARQHRRSVPVTKMIDSIGNFFFTDITAPRFKTEPALSFVVDARISPEQHEAIGAALNQGAFIFIPSQENEHCFGDIRNKRFRMSYMLCPRYKLPLMYGQPVVLSKLLSRDRDGVDGQFTLADIEDGL